MQVDVESLQRLVDFNLNAGVHGLGVALGSEVIALSEAERAQVTQIIVARVRSRVPVVINTGGPVAELAVLYSRIARDNGADALMLRPPTFQPAGAEQIVAYYKAVSDAIDLPIFIQDTPATPVSGSLALRIAQACEHVRYIKVESGPAPLKVAQAVAEAKGQLAVFGGAGGSYLLEELRRRSAGTMPGCYQPKAFVEVWDAFQRGDERAARAAFYRWIVPLNRVIGQAPGGFYHVSKRVLQRRGIIRTTHVRGPVVPLDEATERELESTIDVLYGFGD
jgi:4-hydroxy-tetrahydrodipicolinate synthase